MSRGRLAENPFYVLEVVPSATRLEVERAAQKLLAQLAVGVASSKIYRTPFGPEVRDETSVRTAVAALRNPEERVLYELWAADGESENAAEALPAWPEALRSIGWRAPCTR